MTQKKKTGGSLVLLITMFNRINRVLGVPIVFFLVSTSLFQANCLALGSTVQERNFKRPDPLDHFKYYNGGFDVRNKHYLASAAFTGVHGYAIAGIWLICGIGFGIYMTVKCLTGASFSFPVKHYLDHNHHLLTMLMLFLISLAIAASSLALVTNKSIVRRTERLKGTILGVGGDADHIISKVIVTLRQMQSLLFPYDRKISSTLNSKISNLKGASSTIQHFVHKSGNMIQKAIHTSYVVHIVTLSINLVTLVAAAVLLLLQWRPGLIIIILCFWILTTLCWLLTGFDFFLDTFADDACSVLKDFQENPVNSSLSSIIPCMDNSYARKIMAQIGFTIHSFIFKLNSKMSVIYHYFGLDKQGEASEFLTSIKICDPFSAAPNYTYLPGSCAKHSVHIEDIPQVLDAFACFKANTTEECKRDGRFLPEKSYKVASAYTRSIQELIDIYPDLQSLSACNFVKIRFFDIASHQCGPFGISVKLLWSSMLALSTFMLLLTLLCLFKISQDSKERHFSMSG